jgi:MFS family permease
MNKRWISSRFTQVPALIAVHFLIGFIFWYGIEKIFLSDILHVGPTGVSAIVILYMVMTLVLDVPASVIADRWGRKRMIVLAVSLFLAANVVLALSQNFTMYLAGTALWALFTVSFYGTFEALLFDSLKAEGREASFQKVDAWSRFFFMIGIGIASIASGFLADHFGLRNVYFFTLIPLVAALIVLAFVKEPKVTHDDEVEDVTKRGYFGHLMHAFKLVWKMPKLRLVMFGAIALFFIQTPMYEFNQYIYIELFKSPVLVGIFGGVIGGFVLALGFFIAVRKSFRPDILMIIIGLAITSIALLSNHFSLIFVSIALGAVAMLENALQTNLQHATTSRTRASVTSAVYFAGNVLIIPFIALFGAIAQNHSIWLAYLVDGGVVIVMAITYVILSKRASPAR